MLDLFHYSTNQIKAIKEQRWKQAQAKADELKALGRNPTEEELTDFGKLLDAALQASITLRIREG